jgi:long-chain acyl-CoA synthetase
MTLGDMLHSKALEHPAGIALLTRDTEFSYRELDSASTNLAGWLVHEGLRPGDRMAIHWHNSFEAAVLYFAAFKAGLIAVPVNLRSKAPEIAHVFENSGAALCFSAPAFAPLAEAAARSCPSMGAVLNVLPVEVYDVALPAVDPDRVAVVMYTSGTTARPKGVMCSHRVFLEYCKCVKAELIGSDGIGLCTTPMMHIAALAMLIGSVYGGTGLALLPGFDPAAILDLIERYRCTYTMTLPALLQFVVDEQARSPRDVASLRTVLVGGDSVPLSLQRRFQELFGMPLQEFYGMTEGGFISINPRHAIRGGSMGIPISVVQIRIVDPAGNDVADGETGEIALRSPLACEGYWNDPQSTAALLRNGWLHTGDLGYRDAEGALWFRGRTKQIIVRAGSNISPQEVEEALYQHPAVREAGVVGKPDPVYGEVVVAFVSLRRAETPGDESELREFTRARLADYKTPEYIRFLSELPKGLTGKVDRRALKEMLHAESQSAAGA